MYDVVIIGAGSTGSSAAYHLAKMGYRVAVVDKRGVGQGMTAYSSGIVRAFYSVREVAEMALYSLKFFQGFEREFGVPAYMRTGLLVIAGDYLRDNVEMLRSMGVRIELIDAERVHELIGAEIGEGEVAAWEDDAGYADTTMVANAFATRAKELGASFIVDEAKLDVRGGRPRAITSRHGELMADKYVVAVGVWANKVLPVELPLNIVPEKTLRVKVDRRVPIFFDAINNFYMRPEGESNALLGDLDPGMASADPDSFNPLDRPGIDEAVRYMESAAKRLGWASNMGYIDGWGGLYDVTPDWMPILDEPIKGIVTCVGLSGHGFKLSPALGLMVAEMVRDGRPSSFADVFRLSRFKALSSIRSKYSQGILG
ncbi:oxidoreductase [Thermocladium modestius]|uniref:Oxidoreductase n=1 Tax=Thermocladium modestius TaxID=62609 RepID=A0A830GSJ2_9CREN|nr:FAD-binding oxidoreductase [Thermocladium modestius]GGP20201.1 oxidoreductase [Thermocladium modestius]